MRDALLLSFTFHSEQKICDLRGWPAGSDKNAETHEVMLKIWEGLRSKADKDNDGQVRGNRLTRLSRVIQGMTWTEYMNKCLDLN